MKSLIHLVRIFLTISVVASQELDGDSLIYRRSIQFGEKTLGEIKISEKDEPVDAIYAFGLKHKLDFNTRSILVNEICGHILCSRRIPIIWKSSVSKGDEIIAFFEILEGKEPVDAAHEFTTKHNLGTGYRNAILSEACEYIVCSRVEPVIWRKSIELNGSLHDVVILEGQEPADVIYYTLNPLGVSRADRLQLLHHAKRDGVHILRDHALIFSKDVKIEGEKTVGTVQFHDDLEEPVDVLYQFVLDHNLTSYWNRLSNIILTEACSRVSCNRLTPIVWSQNLQNDHGKQIGTVVVLLNQEPIDAIDNFLQKNQLSLDYRDDISKLACNTLVCNRILPVVYTKEILLNDRESLGTLEILENQEVVDAVYDFVKKKGGKLDDFALKNYFLQEACKKPRVKCTRSMAIVFNRTINKATGENIGELVIFENKEPADVIYEWCQKHNLDEDFLFATIHTVCQKKGVICTRFSPIMFGPKGITGENGNKIGDLEVMLRQEPVDALYGFFSRYRLHGKWDFQSVLNQVCALPGLEGKCRRYQAIKYFDANFSMGNINFGPITIWETEEIVDKLYQIRQEYNLSLQDQQSKLNEICAKHDVFCERSKAIVFHVTGINKFDNVKYGNETCIRRYAGWQYIASIMNTKIGEKLNDFIQRKNVKKMIEFQYIGAILFWIWILISDWFISCVIGRKRYNLFHRIAVFTSVLVITSFVQAYIIEPLDYIDKAMYEHEGKLPDLFIYEEEEPIDAILRWGKNASKIYHPIVREPIFWELLDRACNQTEKFNCKRKRAWELIDMGHITQFGVSHDIVYPNPNVDPIARHDCIPIMDGKADTCIQHTALNVCNRLAPRPENCVFDITLHISSQFIEYNNRRHESKNTYVKLGLEMDSPAQELFERNSLIARKHGQNVSPYKRIDNGTAVYEKWDKKTTIAWSVLDAFHKVKDTESREWNDKPCTPMFGGALCAKTDKDGNMIIEC